MEQTNLTVVKYFVIKGISDAPNMQTPIFLLVLLLYLIIISGNSTIVLLIYTDSKLHTPMYFFLGNLSLLDMSASTVALHKTLTNFISSDNSISFPACIGQFYSFASLAADQLLILAAMSYDRYVAIYNPLRYQIIMNYRVCTLLASVCWLLGFIEFIPYVILLTRVSCYRSNVINHFYCDIVPILNIACSDISALKSLIFTEGMFATIFSPFFLTLISYIFIIITILRINSKTGRRKAFYTCSSHLTVVIILYTTLTIQYLTPNATDTLDSNKLFSLLNTATVPILNPLIYSWKNKDVKSALRRKLKCVL
ncbi:olfactory receptor 1009-like [Bombina bombina]|uniref:olfactory receptor 1009-like n=1 Tax=Bombina bombina TaxID=8345 RepID=UPI00235A5615|nr:olfactory receptor 1009-like [Bombina bombina]